MNRTCQWASFFVQKIGGKCLNNNSRMGNEPLQKEQYRVVARVSEVQREQYTVLSQFGETKAKLKGKFYRDNWTQAYPVVGDYVTISYIENGVSMIEEICERSSYFSRTDFSGHAAGYVKTVKEQVLAANFDYVFILVSMNHDFSENRIARYISTALKSGGKPVVILTKADMCDDVESYIKKVKDISSSIDVIAISAQSGYGMKQIDDYLEAGKTFVFLGSSGVGKSTLVNAVAGEDIMTVSGIREKDSKGRHTTTHRQLIVLPSQVTIIDTPGIRELGMWDAKEGIDETFSDVVELISRCKYSDCSHRNEPGCAVKEAIEEGSLTVERFQAYSQLVNENEWGKGKSAYTKRDKLIQKMRRN